MSKNVWSAGERDVDAGLRKQERCMLAVGVCLIGGSVLVLAWIVYDSCMRWPALGSWAMPLGWTAASYGAVVAAVRGFAGR